MQTYLESSEEFIEADCTVFVPIEVFQELLGFFFGQIESVVDESPSEVIDIQLTVAIVIHGSEDTSDSFNACSRAFTDLLLDLCNQVVDIETMQFFDWCSMGSSWCCEQTEDVLVELELGWCINSDVALAFQ